MRKLGHVLALVAVVAFVRLGIWQLDRLEERQTGNALITARFAEDPAPFADVLAATAPGEREWRSVTVTGRFIPSEEVLLGPLGHRGAPGHDVLTPLLLGDGTALLVDRGWVPYAVTTTPVAQAAPPHGEVTVTGWLRADQPTDGFGPDVAAEGTLDRIGSADLRRLDRQVSAPLQPVWLQVRQQVPANAGDLPRPIDPPVLTDEGSHRSYAVQWFVFAVVVAVGWPVLYRRTPLGARAVQARTSGA